MNTGVGCHFLLALIETLICNTFKMMWFPDVKALFMVQVGFTIGFTKKVHTQDWPLSAPAGLENRGFGPAGRQF